MMEKDTFRSLSQVVFIRGGRSVPPSIKPLNSGGRWQSDAGRRCERICRDSSHFRFIGTAYTIPRTSRILSRIDRSSLDYFLFYYEPMILDLTVDEIPKVKTSLRLFFLFRCRVPFGTKNRVYRSIFEYSLIKENPKRTYYEY